MECIILAGGLGTRLQGVIGAYPKCMAPINGKPFLSYLFDYLAAQQCSHVILSLGFKQEIVTDWLSYKSFPFTIACAIESEPLGTGGGIVWAMQRALTNDVAIINGDTMFKVDLKKLYDYHTTQRAETTLALKTMHQFDRYGVVKTDDNGLITAFEEKRYHDIGTINGGIYMVNKAALLKRAMPAKFSFEKDYLERYTPEKCFYGLEDPGYFIDIGIPEDFERAQKDLQS